MPHTNFVALSGDAGCEYSYNPGHPKQRSADQSASNSNPQAEKIKSLVKKTGTGGKITARLADGRTYHGKIKLIDEDNFQVDEVDLKQVVTINYA